MKNNICKICLIGTVLALALYFNPGSVQTAEKPYSSDWYNSTENLHHLKSNSTFWSDGAKETKKVPLYKIETNRRGYRDQNYSYNSSSKHRIFVSGDSDLFGWGVNSSDRFSDKLEAELNSKKEKNTQIINKAMLGYGLSDQRKAFEYFNEKLDFDKAIFVLSGHDSAYGNNEYEEQRNRLREEIKEEYSSLTEEEIEKKIDDRWEDHLRNLYTTYSVEETVLPKEVEKISETAENHDIEIVYYTHLSYLDFYTDFRER